MPFPLLEEIKRLKAIADMGLLYCANEYDKERYIELQQMSYRLLQAVTNSSITALQEVLPQAKDYPTAKVDVRGMLLTPGKKILMVKEMADGKWALPGGWADIGYSPKESITKEFKEETGLTVTVQKLLAVFDKKMHPHPPDIFYTYKLAFYCLADSFNLQKGFDVLDVDYFDINELPPLSEERIVKPQVELLYNKIISGDMDAYFD